MWQVISGVLQIIFLIMKNKFQKDELIRKEKEAINAEAKEAIKSRDISRINNILNKLR